MTELTVKRRGRVTRVVPEPDEIAVENTENRPYKRAGEACRTSWLLREAKELEIRQFFREIPLTEALSQLASARKNIELGAEIINDRIGKEGNSLRCSTCGGPPKRIDGNWVMQSQELDKDTGIYVRVQYCDVFCVRERNRKKLMPAGANPLAADGTELGDIR